MKWDNVQLKLQNSYFVVYLQMLQKHTKQDK